MQFGLDDHTIFRDWSRRRLRCGSSFDALEKQSSIFAPSFFPIHIRTPISAMVTPWPCHLPSQTQGSRESPRGS